MNDLNEQADVFIESEIGDVEAIKDKKQEINERYERVKVYNYILFIMCIIRRKSPIRLPYGITVC